MTNPLSSPLPGPAAQLRLVIKPLQQALERYDNHPCGLRNIVDVVSEARTLVDDVLEQAAYIEHDTQQALDQEQVDALKRALAGSDTDERHEFESMAGDGVCMYVLSTGDRCLKFESEH